jgi:outer membrane protein TolC
MTNRNLSTTTRAKRVVIWGCAALLIAALPIVVWQREALVRRFETELRAWSSTPVRTVKKKAIARPRLAIAATPKPIVLPSVETGVPLVEAVEVEPGKPEPIALRRGPADSGAIVPPPAAERAMYSVTAAPPGAPGLAFPDAQVQPTAATSTSLESSAATINAPVESIAAGPQIPTFSTAPTWVTQAAPPQPTAPVVAPAVPTPPVVPQVEYLPPTPAAGPGMNSVVPSPQQFNSAQPVPPPPTAQFGAFLAHGTITPDDVRAMALRNNKDIAVLGMVPQVNAALIDSEASVFDPVFNLAMNGGHYKRQVSTQIEALGNDIPVLNTTFWQPQNGLNQLYFEKLFVTGAEVQVGLGQTYLNYAPAGDFVFVNPAYASTLNLQLEQPLFRGRGAAATTAPMQIARANHEQSWYSFLATVNQILRDADYAYWDIYAAFQDFEVRDLAARQSAETVERERGLLNLGEGSLPNVAQAEEQHEAFLIARAEAENRLVDAQRQLRRVMGIPPSDPRPLIPATPPADAPLELDWNYASGEAQNRPEFAAQQAAVIAAETELARRRNGLLPDLSAVAAYAMSGLDDSFDQAWKNVGSGSYHDWTTGFVYRQPLGRRNDRALMARAESALAMETARLRQIEHEILHQLDAAFQHVQNKQQLLALHRRRREAAAIQLTARRELYFENRATLRDQLDAEVRYASALHDEALARVAYQRAVTEWNFARGAMSQGDFVPTR